MPHWSFSVLINPYLLLLVSSASEMMTEPLADNTWRHTPGRAPLDLLGFAQR
jgi:hypothetical protein